MAFVAPFRALRYDPTRVTDLGKVVTPPYDVISPAEQAAFYAADPHNVIRLELSQARPQDSSADNRYTRAAAHLQAWVAEGVLRRDSRPAFFLTSTAYRDAEGAARVRRGLFCLLKLEEFDRKVVLPHEKTFTGHKEDRLKLTLATQANISPVFALYPDPQNQVWETLWQAREARPEAAFTDPQGLGQEMYRVADPAAARAAQALLADQPIFIADGHHRYETALNYRRLMRERHPQAGPGAPFEFVLVYLCSMSDPGLTIFPCHRLLPHLDGFAARDFLALARPYFDQALLSLSGETAADRAALAGRLAQAGQGGHALALVAADEPGQAHLLTLRPAALADQVLGSLEAPLRELDVVILTQLVLENILGFDEHARDQIHSIEYLSDLGQLLQKVGSGQARAGFVLNPTRIEQVQAVARAGLTMPRKATFFYPKVLTGLCLYQQAGQEDISLP